MKIRRNRVTANKRRVVKSACGKRFIKANTYGDMYGGIERSKSAYIDEWQRDYTGTPNTSWDNIFDNVLNEFTLYCGDEVSAEQDERGNYGDTLEEQYDDGRIDSEDIEREFDHWIVFVDLNEYDY